MMSDHSMTVEPSALDLDAIEARANAASAGLTFCGWGYAPGQYGAVVHVFQASDGTLLGVANPRWEVDGDEHGTWSCIEWDRVGTLPSATLNEGGDLAWPPPSDLVLGALSDEQQDDYHDELRDALRETLRD